MRIIICNDATELGNKAARFAARKLNKAIKANGEARMIVSTGSSQFETFQALLNEDINWRKIEIFHLDEYIDLPVTHEASFRKYLYERFINSIDAKQFHAVKTEGDINKNIKKLSRKLEKQPVDLGLIGIGVNGHIAFNDPPADFDSHESYKIVSLDDQCKLQQVNEGWFKTIEDVPKQAVSMTVWRIMQCNTIVSCVPHLVKADAIFNTFTNKTTNMVPATMLKLHSDYHLYLDKNSASRIITF